LTLAVSRPPRSARLRPPLRTAAHSQVLQFQRARLITSLVETVAEEGYERLTVGKVIARARVSRKTFYDVFANRQDAFLAAFEQTTHRMRREAIEAYTSGTDWRSGIRAALARLLTFVDEESGLARLCLIEALGAGERVLARRAELLAEVAHAIDRGRSAAGGKADPPPLTAEALVGGTVAILHNRCVQQGEDMAMELLGPVMSMIVLPYRGSRASRAELSRSRPRVALSGAAGAESPDGDPLRDLNIRVTYRTVRTLMTVGRNPGASNREVSQGAGISDQGQVSKLLNRLACLQLIENRCEGQAKGGANAWHLTVRGAYFEKVVRRR
jgi:AcrR family transcriptional regulator